MSTELGITQEGIKVALKIKEGYRNHEPICVPGDESNILIPEHLLDHNLNLQGIEDPLPLAMMATRDPEAPMALAAATRLMPLARGTKLISGVFDLVGETTKHSLVQRCVGLISENTCNPATISHVRHHARRFVIKTRKQYTQAIRQNMKALMEGTIAPRQFVAGFFELTEAGNLRSDIRKNLVLRLLLSEHIRSSIKFLFLENFQRLPAAVRTAIVAGVQRADSTHHVELIKEELRWIVSQDDPWLVYN